jgi:GT2 family glycosyltransferase
MNSNIDYAVVVPSLGTRASLWECLERALRQSKPPREVLVVVPHDTTVRVPEGVRVLETGASTSAQRNLGVRVASAPIVLFLDDDIMLEPDFAEMLCLVWERYGLDGDLAGVAGTIVNDPWELQLWKRGLRALGGLSHVALRATETRLMASGHIAFVPSRPDESEVRFPPAQCISYRRDLLLEEPFYEGFNGYVLGEDLDLAARLAKRGRLVHTPRARCRHESRESGIGSKVEAAYRRGRMYAFFRGRHRRPGLLGRIAWEWANLTEAAILAARSLKFRDRAIVREYKRGLSEARVHLREERIGREGRLA